MQFIVTVSADDPVIDQIYAYCVNHRITMSNGRMIHVDNQYWYWRIDCDQAEHCTWLQLCWGHYLICHSGA